MTATAPESIDLLLVDDDEVDRTAVRRALRGFGAGLTVRECVNAEDALQALRTARFHCVVLDFQMPGHDGLWVLEQARLLGISVPVIMLTGQGDEQTAVRLMKAGATDYVPKAALTAERLTQSLRHAVRVHHAEQQARDAVHALQESEQRLRLALDAAALGTWAYLPLTDVLTWDGRCRAVFGVGADSEVTWETFRRGVHCDDLEHVDAAVNRALDPTSGGHYDVEYRTVGAEPPHTVRWVRATGQASFSGGRAVRFTGVILDITDRKQFVEEMARQTEFEQQLIGIVSHDLRNPIAAMIMSTSVLLRRPDVSPQMAKSLTRILASGERATRMIHDLLDFTQARRGAGIPIQPAETDVALLAAQTLEEVQAGHPSRQIDLDCELTGLHAVWDADRIAQVLTNLLSNALAYSPVDTPVSLRVRSVDERIELAVHNHGTPIPAAVLSSLFQPFQRGGHASDSRRGLGLGLYIVDQLVRAHTGTVEVVSTADAGTTFCVRLPRQVLRI